MEKIFSKVPKLTLRFWIINMLLTVLEEVVIPPKLLPLGLGYGFGILIFSLVTYFIIALQIKMPNFNPVNYWITIFATSILGNCIIKLICDYLGVSALACARIIGFLLLATFLTWHFKLRTVLIYPINGVKSEVFYWISILLAQCFTSILFRYAYKSEGFFNQDLLEYIAILFIFLVYGIAKFSKNYLEVEKYEIFNIDISGFLILIYIFIFMKFVYSIKNYRIFPYFGFIIFFILSQTLAIIIYNNIKKITKDEFIAVTNGMMSLDIMIPIIVIILLIKTSK